MSSLAGTIAGAYGDLELVIGTVVSFTSATRALTINLGGGDVPNVGYLDSYVPAVGHVVAVLRSGNTALCLGRARGISG